jgi:hypothetical protein
MPVTGIRRREAVLICGPARAGAGSVAVALRRLRPELEVVEPADLAAGQAPAAVVFVVSAAAQLTGSDCALLDTAAAHTDVVVAVVTKTDAHRDWRDTLAADRVQLKAHRDRYRDTPWVGVAAAPPTGSPRLEELLGILDALLSSSEWSLRNDLRSKEFHIESEICRYRRAAEVPQRRDRLARLRADRADVMDRRRRDDAQRGVQLRRRLRETGAELSYLVAARTAAARSELQRASAELTRAAVPSFANRVGGRVQELTIEVAHACDRRVAGVAAELGLDEPAPLPVDLPDSDTDAVPVPAGGLESRLTTLLGAGFGLGFAVTLRRLFDAVPAGPSPLGAALCAVSGVLLAGWIVGIRRLLAQRAAHERWVGEMLGRVRLALDRHIATRISHAERTWTAAEAERAREAAAQTAGLLAAIDTELAELQRSEHRAVADRDRVLPKLQRALTDVRADLNRCTTAGRVI